MVLTAELVKARATRSVWWLGIAAVVTCLAWAAVDVLVFIDAPTDREIEGAYSMAQQGYLFAMIIGVLLVAGEYRHQTITWVLLATPRRGQVIVGKLAACGVIGIAIGLAAAVLTTAVTAVLLAARDFPVLTGGVPLALAGSVVSTMLWALFGAAFGALLRNQVAAIVVAFVWLMYVEWFLVMLLPEVGRWTPTGAAKAVSGWTRDGMPVAGELLPMWAGGLVFLAYTAIAAAVAGRVSMRRDIT